MSSGSRPVPCRGRLAPRAGGYSIANRECRGQLLSQSIPTYHWVVANEAENQRLLELLAPEGNMEAETREPDESALLLLLATESDDETVLVELVRHAVPLPVD